MKVEIPRYFYELKELKPLKVDDFTLIRYVLAKDQLRRKCQVNAHMFSLVLKGKKSSSQRRER